VCSIGINFAARNTLWLAVSMLDTMGSAEKFIFAHGSQIVAAMAVTTPINMKTSEALVQIFALESMRFFHL